MHACVHVCVVCVCMHACMCVCGGGGQWWESEGRIHISFAFILTPLILTSIHIPNLPLNFRNSWLFHSLLEGSDAPGNTLKSSAMFPIRLMDCFCEQWHPVLGGDCKSFGHAQWWFLFLRTFSDWGNRNPLELMPVRRRKCYQNISQSSPAVDGRGPESTGGGR